MCNVIGQANYTPRHFFRQHPYILATLISASGWLVPVPTNWLAGLWIATSLVGGLFALFVFMRKLKLSVATTLIVLMTVVIYPVFTNAYLGQIYMDLLMFGPATALILGIWWMKHKSVSVWRWIIPLTIALGMVSERGAYLAGLIGFGYSLLLFGKHVIYKKEVLCGYRYFETKHPFFLESLLVQLKFNMKICEIPVNWKARNEGKSLVKKITLLRYLVPIFRTKLLPKRSYKF